MLNEIKKSADFLKERINSSIDFGIVLGSGLGNFADQIYDAIRIPYSTIPDFPVSTVKGHDGSFYFGKIGTKHVLAMKGRFHFYEGYSMQQVVMPIRVMHLLGIKTLLVSNAAGGVNPRFKIGDLMIITDQINLFPENPLRGKNEDSFGPRFPDMSKPYDKNMINQALQYGNAKSYPITQGVYAGVTGPTYETPAEYKYLSIIGADAVGMSTVPEVIAAKHCGMNCFGVSVITDLGTEGNIEEISHEMVTDAAEEASPKLTDIFIHLIQSE